jgi:SPP1 gp7 family putative phage head morphogenesis protein
MNWWQNTLSAVRRALTPAEFMTGADLDLSPRGVMHNPYSQSVWVQSAIQSVIGPIRSVPLKFYVGDVEFTDSGLDSFWRRPAVGMSRDEFLDATCGWFMLAGEFFWLLDDSWLTGRMGSPARFIVSRPDEMREIVVGGQLLGWQYRDASNRRHDLLPEQVVHAKRWNPFNRWRGLGQLEAALMAATTDFNAGRFARDSYANAGEQGDYVVAKGAMPTEPQREQMIAALRAKRAAKLRGDFRPVFLTGDIDVKPATVQGPDAAMVANRLQSRHEVFTAFGVPASMADVQASYSIGSASDYFRLIHGTCMPLAGTVAGAITELARRQVRQQPEAFFDFDEHPVMQAVRAERIEAATKLFSLGVPLQAANDYLDMGLKPVPGWDQGWLPFNLQPAGDPLQTGSDGGDTGAADPVQEMRRALLGKAERLKAETPKQGTGNGGQETGCVHCSPGEARNPKWIAHWRSRQETIKTYESKFNRQLMRARAEVLGNLKKADGKAQKSVAAELNFDLEDWGDGLVIEMNKAGRNAMDKAGRQAKAEIGQPDDAWTMPPATAVAYLRNRENLMRDVADSVHQAVEEQLIEGISAGETMQELAERVRAQFNKISAARARTIASTETAAAYGYARQEAFKQSGVAWKQWLTSGNDNVRDTHAAAEGQRRKIEEPFTVGGASLMHPGDDSLGAPPEETINCHCVSIAVEDGGDGGNAES